jgi:molecular chaperone GrpE (heat shock protein)
MELREKNLTVQDRIKNLCGESRTRQFVLEKEMKNIPKNTYNKSTYSAYKETIYKFLKGILVEKEKFENLYEEAKKLQSSERVACLDKIREQIESLDCEFDSALEKLGNNAEFFKEKRHQMRVLPNDERLNLMIQGVDYTVLDIKFEWEEV